MKRTPIKYLEGKTIASIKIGSNGGYVFYNKKGDILFMVSCGWIFDCYGMYFDEGNLEYTKDPRP